MPDPVHLLISIPPTYSVSQVTPLDRAEVPSSPQAPAGHRSLPSSQRRRLRQVFCLASDGQLGAILYEPGDLQGPRDHGRDGVHLEALLDDSG